MLPSYAELYRRELLERVLPFWLEHSLDRECGGYFTCLERNGQVYDTDKFIWLQARQVWTFAMLYDRLEPRPEWKACALHGAAFLERHGRDAAGNWYFALTRDGRPLVQPYNIFSDCFAAMAFGALWRIAPEARYRELARRTWANILRRRDNPKGPWNKAVPGTRPLRNFALPMILCNLALELEPLLDAGTVETLAAEVAREVLEVFYRPEHGLIVENVLANGEFSDSFDGRLLNPGHAIEATWFIMDLAERLRRPEWREQAVRILRHTLEYAWDQQYGGLFYFMDLHGHPPQQLEWDQKLWWVHLETLVALAKAWRLTGDPHCADWFERVHEYTWRHFPDPQFGEWFGYLNRRGEVLLTLKGGKWKGCFHVPRALYQVAKTLG